MSKLKELRQERAEKFNAVDKLIKGADNQQRKMSAEELDLFGTLKADIATLDSEIAARQFAEETESRISQPVNVPAAAPAQRHEEAQTSEQRMEVEKRAYDAWLRGGEAGLDRKPEFRQAMNRYRYYGDDPESRYTAQTVTTTGGGYLIPPGFSNELEKSLKEFGGVRSVARIMSTTSGNTINWPTFDDTANVGELVAINTAATGQALVYGNVTLGAYKYSSKAVLVPIELMQDSAFDVASHVNMALTERIGRITNTHFTTGTGSGQPQGVVTGAALGYTGATGTNATITYAGLTELIHSVDPAYRSNCVFMFNDSTLKVLKQMVDDNLRPLWNSSTAGISGGYPDTICGYRYIVNQDVASMSAGAKSILFGDFSKFIVRDVMPPTLFRLNEHYIESGQVAFLAWSRHDSKVINNGAIKYYVNGSAT